MGLSPCCLPWIFDRIFYHSHDSLQLQFHIFQKLLHYFLCSFCPYHLVIIIYLLCFHDDPPHMSLYFILIPRWLCSGIFLSLYLVNFVSGCPCLVPFFPYDIPPLYDGTSWQLLYSLYISCHKFSQ